MPLYKIIFTDNSIFLGGDTIEDSKWDKIPDKNILCLEYFLCDGSSITLRNKEAYVAITEVADEISRKLGDCPKCNKPTKITNATINHANGKITKKILARCSDKEKCHWVGNINDLKNIRNAKCERYKYIMGLKNGIVTSHRITLKGTSGKDKYQEWDITTRCYPKGKEYNGKEAVADFAWKRGIK